MRQAAARAWPEPARRFARRLAPAPFTLLLIGIACLGAALALARQAAFGAVLRYDSLEYLAVASNLLSGEGLLRWHGGVYSLWPPGYPVLLAIGTLGLTDPQSIAGPLNATLFGITVFAAGRYLQRRLASRFLAAWTSLALALSIPLAWSAAQVLSETLFILLATGALIWLDKFLRDGRMPHLVLAAALSALAWQTRYIGAALAAFAGLALLLQQGAALSQRARRAALFALICGAPMAVWLLRNWLLTGVTTTHFQHPRRSALEEGSRTLSHLADWLHFGPSWLPLSPDQAIWLVLGPTLLAAIAWPLLAKRARPPSGAADWLPAALFGGFALAYFITLLGLILHGVLWHGIEARYLLPLYVPFAIAAATALDRFLAIERERPLLGRLRPWPGHRRSPKPSNAAAAVLAALSLWLAGQAMPNWEHVGQANAGNLWQAYSGERWQRSETLRHIRENPLPGEIWAPEPIIVRFHNSADARYRYLPGGGPGSGPKGLPALRRQLAKATEHGYLVWAVESMWRSPVYPFGPANLRTLPGLAPFAELADGVIFRIDPKHVPAPGPNPYLTAQAAIASGELGPPLARSVFDLRLLDGKLVYAKAPCAAQDTQAYFFLHVLPADAADLPADSRRRGYERLGFNFHRYGAAFDGTCLALAPLPEYPIEWIRTGQSERGKRIWEATLTSHASALDQP